MFFILLLASVDWIVLMVLVCVELVGRAWRRISPDCPPVFPPCRPECSFIVGTWHAKQALTQSLPALLQAVRSHGGDHEVILVVDYESRDGTEEYVRRTFPEVKIVVGDHPLYFNGASRLGIKTATRDIVVLVNNDVLVDESFVAPLIAPFNDPNVFGVASHMAESAGFGETGKTTIHFNGCDFNWVHDAVVASDPPYCAVSWLHRGALALDRRKYHLLGGLDDLYDPLYFEDADLSYKAWKVGWKCVFSSKSRVTHNHRLEVSSAAQNFLHMVVRRNATIFFWKNINNLRMLLVHFGKSSVKRACRAKRAGRGSRIELHAFFAALKRLPIIVRRRLRIARWIVRSDREVLAWQKQPFVPWEEEWRPAKADSPEMKNRT
jgi:GT2 family glycosyltransferase